MNMEQFEKKVTEMITSSVTPLLEEHGKTLEEVKSEVNTKIEEITGQLKARPVISGGEEPAEKDPKGGFKNFSHFAKDVASASRPGNPLTKELDTWTKIAKAADSTSLIEHEDQYGGFLIPPEFRQELWLAVEQKNEILPRCTQIPMTKTTLTIPFVNGFDESGGLVYGGIEWKWTDELGTKTATRPAFGRITLNLKKITGLCNTSDELLEDSPISLEVLLKNGFRDGLYYQLNEMFIRGSGAGQPLGIINAPCLVTVAKETGQAANTLIWENVLNMYSRVFDKANVVWIANEDCLPQLATMALAVGTGGVPVWLPPGGASGKPYDTLMGKPLFWNKHCTTVGSPGDIILADWSQYLVGMKSGQGATGKFDTSIHFRFDADQTVFRFVFRFDGQPWWPTYYTPPQATTNTMSPFIVCAER